MITFTYISSSKGQETRNTSWLWTNFCFTHTVESLWEVYTTSNNLIYRKKRYWTCNEKWWNYFSCFCRLKAFDTIDFNILTHKLQSLLFSKKLFVSNLKLLIEQKPFCTNRFTLFILFIFKIWCSTKINFRTIII